MGKSVGIFLLVVALLFALAPGAGAQEVAWEKIYPGTPIDRYYYDLQQTPDGGYILCGYEYDYTTRWDVLLTKTDANGNIEWDNKVSLPGFERGYSLQLAADGGYIVAGNVYVSSASMYDALLMKIDASGNLEWQAHLGAVGAINETCDSVQLTADGGYILAGYSQISGYPNDALLIKADADGNMEWLQTFGGTGYDSAMSAHQTPDGGYIFCGRTFVFAPYNYEAWLVKTDAGGSMEWEKTFGGYGTQMAENMQPTADGGYILCGYSYTDYAMKYDALLIKTDAVGNQQWYKTLGATDYEYADSVQQTADGGYILGGYQNISNGRDGMLIKTDSGGNTEWLQNYGGTGYDFFESAIQTADGGYAAAGYNRSETDRYAGWLLKVASANQPPAADAGADQNLAAGESCTASALLDGSASTDPDSTPGTNDDIVSFDWCEGTTLLGSAEILSYPFGVGSYTVTLTVTDQAGATASDDMIVSVADLTPPVLTVPADIVVECSGPDGQSVDIGLAAASDNCCPAVTINDAPGLFFLGTTAVTWSATDCYDNISQGTQNITVQDTTPPELSVSLSPDVLWPPNHKMIEIVPTITASDICCSDVTVSLVSITMNEGDVEDTFDPLFDINPETGYIGEDMQIIDGQVFVRAERSGKSDGRIYTLTYEAVDCEGNTTTVDVIVTVPHDMS